MNLEKNIEISAFVDTDVRGIWKLQEEMNVPVWTTTISARKYRIDLHHFLLILLP